MLNFRARHADFIRRELNTVRSLKTLKKYNLGKLLSNSEDGWNVRVVRRPGRTENNGPWTPTKWRDRELTVLRWTFDSSSGRPRAKVER